jgi:putative hemolysin
VAPPAATSEDESMLDPVPAAIGLVFLLALSGFFSGSETALIAANRYRLSYLAKQGDRRAERVRALQAHPEYLISTILVGNNFANIAASVLATAVAIRLAGERGPLYATVVMTLLILVLAEIVPKTLAARYPEQVSFLIAGPITLVGKLLHPVAVTAAALANALLLPFGKPGEAAGTALEEEIKAMIAHGGEGAAIAHDKRRMLSGIFRLGDLTIEDVMVPRTQVAALDIEAGPEQISSLIQTSGFSRFPVYRGTLDHIVGVLNSKDVFRYSGRLGEMDLESLLRQPLFVPESAPLRGLLQAFQQQRQHLAIVIDEYGGVEGIVSLEDLLEEIVGEIDDEFDLPRAPWVTELESGALVVGGTCPLSLLRRHHGLDLAAREAATIAGFILELTGRIPAQGERIAQDGLTFVIERARPNRVDRVRIEGM